MDIKVDNYGDGHLETAVTLENLGNVYYNKKEIKKMEEYLIKSLNIKINHYGEGHV